MTEGSGRRRLSPSKTLNAGLLYQLTMRQTPLRTRMPPGGRKSAAKTLVRSLTQVQREQRHRIELLDRTGQDVGQPAADDNDDHDEPRYERGGRVALSRCCRVEARDQRPAPTG